MGGMGPTIFFTAALAAEGEIGPATFLTAAGGHGQVGVMGRREPEIGPATFFALQLPVSATDGRKSETGPTPAKEATVLRAR